jgi:uncharacterized membrane protein
MARTVVGLFDDRDDADRAVREIVDIRIPREQISVVTSDPDGRYQSLAVDEKGNMAGEGAATGAGTGAVLGGALGLLVGAGMLAFPAAGLVAAGPIAGLLAGAAGGAVAGGIVGGLVGMGIPEEHAHTYAESVRRGGVLVVTTVPDTEAERVADIMDRYNAADVEERAANYRAEGFTSYQTDAEIYGEDRVREERDRQRRSLGSSGGTRRARTYGGGDDGDEAYRKHFQEQAHSDGSWEEFEPAYHFGAAMAYDVRFKNRDWPSAAPELRREWEQSRPGSWQRFEGAVKAGWEYSAARSGSRASVM